MWLGYGKRSGHPCTAAFTTVIRAEYLYARISDAKNAKRERERETEREREREEEDAIHTGPNRSMPGHKFRT